MANVSPGPQQREGGRTDLGELVRLSLLEMAQMQELEERLHELCEKSSKVRAQIQHDDYGPAR